MQKLTRRNVFQVIAAILLGKKAVKPAQAASLCTGVPAASKAYLRKEALARLEKTLRFYTTADAEVMGMRMGRTIQFHMPENFVRLPPQST